MKRNALFGLMLLFAPHAAKAELRVAAPDERPIRPYRGLTYTEEGIREVRRVARESERGRKLAADLFAATAVWLALPEAEVRRILPGPKDLFAGGIAGDPQTGEPWPSYGRGADMCCLDRPGTVRSPATGILYGNAKPGEPFHDNGSGWRRPSDGKIFYFKGIWHTWLIQSLHVAADDLALAYMLSGEEAVAERGLFLLDALAALRVARGEEKGLSDMPSYGLTNKCYLAYRGHGANARVFRNALCADLLLGSPAASRPSAFNPSKSVLEQVRDGCFGVFELRYKQTRGTLYNHVTALYANQIAQAVLFGNPEALKEGLSVIAVWLNQCVNRDGHYSENAGGYERVGVADFANMLLPLSNYAPEKYAHPESYPQPDDVAESLRIGDDPRWLSAAFLMKERLTALGRVICFGDMWEDRLISFEGRPEDLRTSCAFARLLFRQTRRPEWRNEIARRFWTLPEAVRNEPALELVRTLGMSQWLDPLKATGPAPEEPELRRTDSSDLLPGKMMALLRSGQGLDSRVAFMRGSVPYGHGHDDQMGLILYAKGMCLTGLYGYPLAGSPAHRGWATRSVSHGMLVVNEDLPFKRYPGKVHPPASLLTFVTQTAGGAAQLVELSNPELWQQSVPDMTDYRRLVWLVDTSDGEFYFLDVFQAQGGTVHDYCWTGQWQERPRTGHVFSVRDVTPVPVDGAWTLAGLNPRFCRASYNERGQSWGERVESGPSGKIRPSSNRKEKINVDAEWEPPPGNGYGFLYDVRVADTTNTWASCWPLIDQTNVMRLTFFNPDGAQQAITAKSPTLEGVQHHDVAIARRTGTSPLRSRFAGLVEVAPEGLWPVAGGNVLAAPETGGLVLRLALRDGCRDTLLMTPGRECAISAKEFSLRGSKAFVRQSADGELMEMAIYEGTELSVGTTSLRPARPAWESRVTAVFPGDTHNRVEIVGRLPQGLRLAGHAAIFSGAPGRKIPYAQEESYILRKVEAAGTGVALCFGWQRLIGAKIQVAEILNDGRVSSFWPNEIRGGKRLETGYFQGRLAVASEDTSRRTHVAGYPSPNVFEPLDRGVFRAGDRVEFHMVQAGDTVRIPAVTVLRKTGPGRWKLSGNMDVELELPAQPGETLRRIENGRETTLTTATSGFVKTSFARDSLPEEGGIELILGVPAG